MQNLIPKAIRRIRLEFFRDISIIEFILAVAWIILVTATVYGTSITEIENCV